MSYKRYLTRFLLWLFRDIKYYGVVFDSQLPPEFIISDHARKRLFERLRCRARVMKKVARKAWYSKEQVNDIDMQLRKPEYRGRIYRKYMGLIFVYKTRFVRSLQYTQKILITVKPMNKKRKSVNYNVRPHKKKWN